MRRDLAARRCWRDILLLFLFAPFLLMIAAMGREDLKAALPGVAMSYLALPYIGLPLLLMAMLRDSMRGWVYVLFTFFAVWVGDTAAMYVGKSMGRHKLAPRISPGKTIEGTVASLVFSVGVCCLFAHFVPEIAAALGKAHLLTEPQESLLIDAPPYGRAPLWLAALLAVMINVAAQVGDLLESALKRGAGVKDSGNLLPGHGGNSGPDRCVAAGAAGGVCAVPCFWTEIRARVGGRVKLVVYRDETNRNSGLDRLDWLQHPQNR